MVQPSHAQQGRGSEVDRRHGSGDVLSESVREFIRLGRFRPAASYQRFAYVCSGLLLASGLFHLGVFLVDGGPWEGPVSWRKPVVFGLSFGITLATVSWFMSFLRPRKSVGWLVIGTFAVASLAEVFLVSMQKWRGVASHFNNDTAFDGIVFSAMGSLVTVLVLLTVFITVRSFLALDAPVALAWAIRTGLVLMLVSQAVGVQMITEGGNTFGAAGALKVPHAVTLHAIQVLPALALLSMAAGFSERHGLRMVALGATGYGCVIAGTMVQTYSGRGPLDVGLITSAFGVLGLGLLAASALVSLVGLRSAHVAARA
ncbi:MAG TPA: hypothetical protein VKB14_17295 [Actinomycetales bacterium]|nr:hypothetical protein [Actinomycetales bacterium]